jgi:rod shape-determining protein MreC
MEFLPHNADVRVGDLLVTSGLGGRFPVGYPVGSVISVDFPQGKSFAEIAVAPAARLSTSREVMLVLPGEKIEFGITYPLEIESSDGQNLPDQPVENEADTPVEDGN